MTTHVRVLGRRFAWVSLIVCLQALTWACGPRSAPVDAPAPPPVTQPPETPAAVQPPPKTPPTVPPVTNAPPQATPSRCALIEQPGEPIERVALGEPVNASNAPRPSNDSERLLFRQVYETLIRIDCEGRPQPGLAASWRLDADGRTWILTLRENARFSDGTPVTPADVRASWSGSTPADALRPDASRLVESVVPVDDRSLAIVLRSSGGDAPLLLAHTDLAIAKRAAESPWPLGTRADAAVVEGGARAGGANDPDITVIRENLPPIRFVVAPGDPRDLLDRGVDLMLTRDPATLEYSATLPHFLSLPTEWHRLHVLVAPGRSREAPMLSENARQVLADDAVRGEARGAAGPFWWQTLDECPGADVQPRQPTAPARRIVYDARDAVARDLAERFVGQRTYERAVGLTSDTLARALRTGTEAGYVIAFDRRSLSPCRDVHALIDRAPWLDPATIVPLVETRLRAIVRRGRSGITADWDAGLLLAGAGGPR